MKSTNSPAGLPGVPAVQVTRVAGIPRFQSSGILYSPMAKWVALNLFPGSFGRIKYEILNKKVANREGDFEPMAADVSHHQIESSVGSRVGFYLYPAAQPPRQVVIFCHGNIRPSWYMNKFLEQLSNHRQRVVVARDFVGYDSSSRVPNEDGALEIAAIANDLAVYDWVVGKYPDAEIIVGGRSIGTTGWANLLPKPKVKKAFGVVPFSHPAGAVYNAAVPGFASHIPFLKSLLRLVSRKACDRAFPTYSDDTIQTFGFSAAKTIDSFPPGQDGKEVMLLKAENDKLVPEGDAEILATKLQSLNIQTRIVTMKGGHNALPNHTENPNAEVELEAFLSSGLLSETGDTREILEGEM